MSSVLEARKLTKEFQRGDVATVALRDFNLKIEKGTFVTVLGRSGCGKSTMLNLLSGLTRPSGGHVLHLGRTHTGPSPEIGYMTQTDTLMPWATVEKNVRMPMQIAGVDKAEARQRTAQLISQVGLDGFAESYPRELSGGMRRRASLARLLATGAKTILLDEPFGALDAQLKAQLQTELSELYSQAGLTVVFVTHDIEEALLLADRVVMLGPIGSVIADIPVTLERPRDPDYTKIDPQFIELHKYLTRTLRKGAMS